jgi:hypothetical protein
METFPVECALKDGSLMEERVELSIALGVGCVE